MAGRPEEDSSNETATTTTTETPETTTTTTEATSDGRGELVPDQSAQAEVLGGDIDVAETDAENAAANIEQAKAAALENHAADHANDHEDGRSKPSAV